MTEEGAAYKTDKCQICGTPIKVIASAEGTCYAAPLYASDREKQQVYAALVGERSRVLVLQAQVDGLVRERDAARVEVARLRGAPLFWTERQALLDTAANASSHLTTLRRQFEMVAQQRDSALEWAARWKRSARRNFDYVPASPTLRWNG